MGKQKVVLKLTMEDARKRTKALKTVVGLPGVISASLEQDKGQIVVVGDDIDAVILTNMLRKRMGSVDLVSVAAVEEKKEEKKQEKKETNEAKNIQPIVRPYYYSVQPHTYHYSVQPDTYYYETPQQQQSDDTCCIM